jgi:hypothetical protein
VTPGQSAGIALTLTIALLPGRLLIPGRVQTPQGPPVPYEDAGACPGEGCVYREWTARAAVAVRRDRKSGSPVLFNLRKAEKATALTGVVITTRPGRVQFREPVDLGFYDHSQRSVAFLHVDPSQTLYLLTYRGEGTMLAWLDGRLYDEVDGSTAFFDDKCAGDANRCTGKIVQETQAVWWVQLRNAKGQTGWTNQPEQFDGKDAIADGR